MALLLVALVGGCAPTATRPLPQARDGLLRLDDWDFRRDGLLPLDGEWLWYWQQLLGPGESAPATGPFRLPQLWNGKFVGGRQLGGLGYATFRLRLQLPTAGEYGLYIRVCAGAFRLFLNDVELAHGGQVGRSAAESQMACSVKTPTFRAAAGESELTLQLANFQHARGGLRSSILLGSADQISSARERRLAQDALVIGGIALVMLNNLAIYWLRRKEATPLFLSLFCGLIAVWLGQQGAIILPLFLPTSYWPLLLRIEYLALYLMPIAAGEVIRSALPRDTRRWLFETFYVMFCALSLTVVLTPPLLFTRTLGSFSALVGLFAFMAISTVLRAALRQRPESMLLLLGMIPVAVTGAVDAVATFRPQNVEVWTPFGALGLIVAWALVLARRSALAQALAEQQRKTLSRLNVAYYRFVPREFLRLLGKSDITTVEIGDQVQREMTVVFADIRGFTSLSEQMSPQENFAFVNKLLGSVGPLIRQHRGFIDKYLGDGIMALFPQEPADALTAAEGMRRALGQLNAKRLERGEPEVRLGIGIHTGSIMLGTVGEPARMDGTVISDVVNTASRLESLTKRYGVTVLISDEVARTLPPELRDDTRPLATVRAKGKLQPIALHEYFGGDSIEQAEQKRRSRDAFSSALRAYQSGAFSDALAGFAAVRRQNPADGAAAYYLQQSEQRLDASAASDWDGIETMTEK